MTPATVRRGVRAYVSWVLYDADIDTLELWTTVNAFLWGVWLANPWFQVFYNGSYGAMSRVMPELVWGMLAMGAASMQLVGRMTDNPRLVRYGARGIAALWMFGAAAIAWDQWRWASIVTYPMMAAASLFVSYRAASYPTRHHERHATEGHRGGYP